MMIDTPFIRLKNVSKSFGSVHAVRNVSLDINKGELFCLLGGSGCGKTTLLRMLAGFETPSAGEIEIDGQDMAKVPAHLRPTNMMFQSYALFPHMNVAKNIGYGLRRAGVARNEINDRVDEMLSLVQLSGYGARKPSELSGGQRQRVALARSLIKKPKLLLLDEPLGALDKKLREETQFELVNIQEQLGITFVVVTHDQEEAMTLANRIAIMDKGDFRQVGRPAEIYESPNSRMVADFIGSINMFKADVTASKGENLTLSCEGLNGPVSATGSAEQAEYFAVRPEKIEIKKGELKKGFTGRIEDIAYMGNQSIYVVEMDGGATIRVTRSNRTRKDEASLTWDDRVTLSWAEDAGMVLPA